jgi:hypothetical protein
MITQDIADYLLGLPKKIIEDEELLETFEFAPRIPIVERLYAASVADKDVSFFIDIKQSSKKILKITLHFQEDNANILLLRVDFNGRHLNPESINDKVPDEFKQFAGKWIEESHIHYYVEGYKPLAWAIPLSNDDSFAVKEFNDVNDVGIIIQEFGKRINLQTRIKTIIQSVIL